MQNASKNITAAGTAFALFCPGLGLFYYACMILGTPAPFHISGYMLTGIAIAGLLSEASQHRRSRITSLLIGVGIPATLLTYLLFTYLGPAALNLHELIPGLMQARPAIYFSVAALWINRFGRPQPSQLSFFSAILALLTACGFILQVFKMIPFSPPGGAMGASLISISLLCGLCATFDEANENPYDRMIILTGIFCTLNRHTALIGVMLFFLFAPKNGWKRFYLILAFLLFTYLSIAVQDMTLLNNNDIPTYWIWAAGIELINRAPEILLTGMPVSTPLPLSVPSSLWQVWYEQQQVWTDFGVFVFNVRPFWLNIVLSWGLGGLLLCAMLLTRIGRKFDAPFCHALIFTVIVTASFEPAFNSAAEATILFISFFTACRKEEFTFS